MPTVAETRKCVVCGKEITRDFYSRSPERTTCSRRCAGALPKLAGANRKWKQNELGAGRWKLAGYIAVARSTLGPEDLKLVPADGLHYVLEHRLVVARRLGRPLFPNELVRHLNGDKADNRPENLVLGSHQENTLDHVSLRNELALWKSIAMTLLAVLRHRENG